MKIEKNELIKEIKKKKELKGLTDLLINKVIEGYLKRHNIDLNITNNRDIRIIIKDARAELRKLSGRFQIINYKRKEILNEEDIENLLKTHRSTAERLEFYPELKKLIEKLKVESILDLGCGLNPLALVDLRIQYYAVDVREDELEIVKDYFSKNKVNGKVVISDISDINLKKFKIDLCLILKVLDILPNKKEISEKILKELQSKHILISFATKTLSGKQMKFMRRIWLERILKKLNLSYKIFNSNNELFYMISAKE